VHFASLVDFNYQNIAQPISLSESTFTIGSNSTKIPLTLYSSLSHFYGDVIAEEGMACKGISDISIYGSYSSNSGFSGRMVFIGDVQGSGNTEADVELTI
jgi:hypothetical protein